MVKDSLLDAEVHSLALTDASSLYDSVEREVRRKEPRVALAVAEIQQPMAAYSFVAR